MSGNDKGKKKASEDDKDKKPEPKQGTLELAVVPEIVLDEPFIGPDGKLVTGKILQCVLFRRIPTCTCSVLSRRLVAFTKFANDHESMFYIRNEPSTVDWSHGKVNVSRLFVRGQATAIRLMVIGYLSWNGLLPTGRGEDGVLQWPKKAKVSIKCLRDGDFLHLRNLIKDHSNSSA